MTHSEFWNPFLETLPRQKLEQLQLFKFKRIFTWLILSPNFIGACMMPPVSRRMISRPWRMCGKCPKWKNP